MLNVYVKEHSRETCLDLPKSYCKLKRYLPVGKLDLEILWSTPSLLFLFWYVDRWSMFRVGQHWWQFIQKAFQVKNVKQTKQNKNLHRSKKVGEQVGGIEWRTLSNG